MGHVLHQAAKIFSSPIVQPLRLLPKSIAPIATNIASTALGMPWLGALVNGVNTYSDTGSLKAGALNAGLTYAGANLGASLFPGAGNIADALESGLGADLGSAAVNAVGGNIANTSLGALAGGFAGNSIASSFAPQGVKGTQAAIGQPTPFSPKQDNPAALPPSLSTLGGLTPIQQASNVATGGVYGGGNGPDEQSYFTNLINRQLVDQTGKVSDLSTLNPIENSYLQQIGLGGYGNSQDLLKAISKFKPA